MVNDWDVLYDEISEAFTPGAPIRERDLFAGRIDQIGLLLDAVRQSGRHAVIFGERGVGKTSLANIFATYLNVPTNKVIAEKINADPTDDFSSLWRKVFERFTHEVKRHSAETLRTLDQDYQGQITPDDVQLELANFSANVTPIIIIDEFDRVRDAELPLLMTDTMKALSDYSLYCTLVLVCVAENIGTLVSNHASVSRQLLQVQMPRMS